VIFGGRNQRRTIRGRAGTSRGNGINELVYSRGLLVGSGRGTLSWFLLPALRGLRAFQVKWILLHGSGRIF
jgi:hypothetical protein